MDVKKLVKNGIPRLTAYNAKEIPCRIKLDANESPYGFSSSLKVATSIPTNRYPDAEAKEFRNLISEELGVKPENVLHGNGSDELIYYLITTFGGPVCYPVPTFSMYGIISQALSEKKIEIRLDEEFDLDLDKVLCVIKREKPKLIFFSSPNNPTGNCFSSHKILKIIEVSRGIVILDEAYQPFSSRQGFLPLLKDYENLIILRTLSKIGLAALRVGFLIADVRIIKEVNKVRLPFNVNSFSQAIAVAALKEKRQLHSHVKAIVSERERLLDEMEKIIGIRPFPSEANFILFKARDADKVYRALLKQGILVRNIKDVIKDCLRVTVGTPDENTAFLKALGKVAL